MYKIHYQCLLLVKTEKGGKMSKSVRRMLLASAGVLFLLCASTIGLLNKAFASNIEVQCHTGDLCGGFYILYDEDGNGEVWMVIEGWCSYSSNGEGCSCANPYYNHERPSLV